MTVKNLKLEDSLEQFVNGEILEGDNAYFCEKCNERVSMVYRYNFTSVSGKVETSREKRKTSRATSGSHVTLTVTFARLLVLCSSPRRDC